MLVGLGLTPGPEWSDPRWLAFLSLCLLGWIVAWLKVPKDNIVPGGACSHLFANAATGPASFVRQQGPARRVVLLRAHLLACYPAPAGHVHDLHAVLVSAMSIFSLARLIPEMVSALPPTAPAPAGQSS